MENIINDYPLQSVKKDIPLNFQKRKQQEELKRILGEIPDLHSHKKSET
jgi:hypothetical protein